MKKAGYRIISTVISAMLILEVITHTSPLTYLAAQESTEGWNYVTELPKDVNAVSHEIQYQNVYEQHGDTIPGTGWTDTGIDEQIYVKSGSTYEADSLLTTSDSVRLDHYYYYHYCGKSMGTSASFQNTEAYTHFDEINEVSSVYEYASYMDEENNGLTYYHLKWSNGGNAYCYRNSEEGTCDGTDGQHGTRSCYWYKMYVYQNYTLETLNLYQKVSEWGVNKDASATTVNIRYRLKPEGITLDKASATLNALGEKVTLSATVSPSDVYDKTVTWKSSNTAVATVDANGVVTAIGNGVATIIATTNSGNKTASCEVTVSVATEGVSINKTSATLTSIGQVLQLTASVQPSNAANKLVTWQSSDASVATVSSSGLVTAVGNGTTTITVTTIDGKSTATCKLTVSVAVTNVSLSQSNATFSKAGETLQLTATVAPSNAVNKALKWTSSDESVVTVSDNGLITAVGNGTATITATSVSGTKTAKCRVAVNIATEGVRLNHTTATLMRKGGTLQLEATILPDNAENKKVIWKSSDTSVAKVDANGLVTAVGDGIATITVTTVSGEKTATCKVTVDIVVPLSILAQPEDQIADEGSYVLFSVECEGKGLQYQWQFSQDGANWSNSSMEGAKTASMNVQGLLSRHGYQYRCVITDKVGDKAISEPATLTVKTMEIIKQPENQTIRMNEMIEFVVEAEGNALSYQWQFSKDGEVWYDSGMEGSHLPVLSVQGLASRDGYQYRCVITDANGNQRISDPATLVVETIEIIKQPENQSGVKGSYVQFVVEATGDGLTYQWQFCKDGEYWSNSSMDGSQTACMDVQVLESRKSYQYRCVIKDMYGKEVISEAVGLTIMAIEITKQPESRTVARNEYIDMVVEAIGEGLSYQWQFCKDGEYWSDSGMEGSQTPCMAVQGLESRDGYQYRCVITDVDGNVMISEPAVLTVSIMEITKQPENQTATIEEYVVFEVAATGNGLNYQWQFSKDGEYWFDSSMAGSDTASMSVQALESRNGYLYRCVVTDAEGTSAVSDSASLAVIAMQITKQPQNQSVAENGYATFSVEVSGDNLSYQWQFCRDGEYWSNSSMEGSTTANMKVQALASRDGYLYRCVITDMSGNTIVSEPGMLTIAVVEIAQQPQNQTAEANAYIFFTVKAEGQNLSYQWQFCRDGNYWSNSSMEGAQTASMRVQALANRNGYQYRCIITDEGGNKVISNPATLRVN